MADFFHKHKRNSAGGTAKDRVVVAICIITYKRPQGLQRLLESLSLLKFNEFQSPFWLVVVVDNDANGSAKEIVEQAKTSFPVEIIYGIEPTQGIASARNTSIAIAPKCDFVAFIDDDEIADPSWLEKLLIVQKEFDADIVTGPVFPEFEDTPQKWITRAGLFQRRRLPTGKIVHYAATHNTLVKFEWMEKIEGPFDIRFNLTGGSDSHFSRKVIIKGGKIVWADEAIVREINPLERMKSTWLLQRAFRLAYTTTLIEKSLYSSFIIFLRFIKAIYNILTGILLFLPFILVYGYAGIIRSFQLIARGSGALYAFFGGKYEEYAQNEKSVAESKI